MIFKILMAFVALCTTGLMVGALPPGAYLEPFQPPRDETWYYCLECDYNEKNKELCCSCPSKQSKDPVFVRSCARDCVSYTTGRSGPYGSVALECEDPQIHGPRLLREARARGDQETVRWLLSKGVKE